MDNAMLIAELREICRAPGPVGKEAFFQRMEKQGAIGRRPVVMNHGEFLMGQLLYIGKWVWVLSAAVLLFMTGLSYQNTGAVSFALTPLLAAGILAEPRRSFRWKMAELEYAARFSLRSVMLARMFLVGVVDSAGLLAVLWAVRPLFPYSPVRVFLYMTVPFLSASLLGSLWERRQRADHGLGSVLICMLSSAFFVAAPVMDSRLYEEKLTVVWAAVFLFLICSLAVSMRGWIREMEEPVWSL